MPLPLPNLDDRRWLDLVEQGRALIPLYAPAWTDHNASDPGITLMELLAWIAEGDIYRLNRVSARQKRRLLHLLNIRPEPPSPSTAVAELRLSEGAEVTLPPTIELSGNTLNGRPLVWRSLAAVNVVRTELRAVQRKDRSGFQNATAAWARQDTIPAFGEEPIPGTELYLGFEQPIPAGVWFTLYVLVSGPKGAPEERRRILAETHATTLPTHHSARIDWEYLADAGGTGHWTPLESDDDTRSLTLSGAVRLRPAAAMTAQAVGQVPKPLYYVRARFSSGAFDETPRIDRVLVNGVELEQATSVTQTWSIHPGAVVTGTPVPGSITGLHLEMHHGGIGTLTLHEPAGDEPRFLILDYVAATATTAGTITVDAALAGVGTGEPEQMVTIGPRPVVERSFRLFSLEGGGWRRWTRVDDFAGSARASAHFQLNPSTGEIAFGDGEKGRTPVAGTLLIAFYDSTAAKEGTGPINGLAATPRNRVLLPDPEVASRLSVSRQASLESGSDAETLTHAIGRAVQSREAGLRAVTVEDIEAIALATPGTRMARAAALPNLYPGLDCVRASGVVTVVVVPSVPLRRPSPSPGLIASVSRYLGRRRTIGTRIVVTGPQYLEVSVRARVRALEGADRRRVQSDVSAALDEFLHALRGGPDRTGWPLGRDLFRAEVMQVIDETAGVDHVLSLELVAGGCAGTCGNICLPPTALPAAGVHAIEVL